MERQHKITFAVPETIFRKLRQRKDDDGFGNKDWTEWLRFLAKDVRLMPTQKEMVQIRTKESLLKYWMQNFAKNLPYIIRGKTIADEVPLNPDDVPKGAAIVVGAGPSIWKHKHLDLLAEKNFKGMVIATDRMLIPCLEKGIIPDYTCSVDGNRDLVMKWYDNPIVDKYGPKLKVCLITCVANNVLKRCLKAKMQVRWFHPLFDDWRQNESFTKIEKMMTSTKRMPDGIAAMQAGGNCGSTCWILAHALLRRSPVALIGIDFGYPEGTPIEETAYYHTLQENFGTDVQKMKLAFRSYYNPDFGTRAFAESVFQHYRQTFLELIQETPEWVETINCTEGGTLFGTGIKGMKFDDFLAKYGE